MNTTYHKKENRLFPHYNLSCTDIAKVITHHFEIPVTELKGESRVQWFVKARHIFAYLTFHFSRLPLAAIGGFLNGRDHTTIIHSIENVNNALSIQDERVVSHVELLQEKLQGFTPKPQPSRGILVNMDAFCIEDTVSNDYVSNIL